MYCVSCGSQNPEHGKFCHNCGSRLVGSQSNESKAIAAPLRTVMEEDRLIQLLKIDPQPNLCHRCGAAEDLTRHKFALAKVTSVKREWGETVGRLGLSAVSIVAAPVMGFGMFSWKGPNKSTSFKLINAELVLCRPCLLWAWKPLKIRELKDDAYRCHPWAEGAKQFGYVKFLSAEKLSMLKPIHANRLTD